MIATTRQKPQERSRTRPNAYARKRSRPSRHSRWRNILFFFSALPRFASFYPLNRYLVLQGLMNVSKPVSPHCSTFFPSSHRPMCYVICLLFLQELRFSHLLTQFECDAPRFVNHRLIFGSKNDVPQRFATGTMIQFWKRCKEEKEALQWRQIDAS